MNVKTTLLIIIFIILCLISWNRYVCNIKGLCEPEKQIEVIKPPVGCPIMFYAHTDSPYLCDFKSYCDSISKLSDTIRLDIVGQYYSNELNSTTYPNLGLARAYKLKSLLSSCGLDTSKVALIGQEMTGESNDSLIIASYIAPSAFIDMASKDVQIITNNGVTEIYFPFNSTQEIKSKALDSFLMQLSVTNSGKKIYITGHTDNVGNEESNKALSLKRCDAIKNEFIKYKILDSNIICQGMGSSMPKVDNSTPENRALNRRVEIKIK